jgi:hypothetical protein
MNKLIQRSFLNALGTVAYVAGVALVMQNGEKLFGEVDTILAPIAFLTTFVLSAAVTGSLVLGRPLLMYFNNEKMDALRVFIYTLAWLALFAVIIFVSAILAK